MVEGGAAAGAAGGSETAASEGTWVRAAGREECPPGALLGVNLGDEPVVLANVDGTVYALLDRCSHQDFPLSDGELEGTRLECIYHGAHFDVCTGRALTLPAVRGVQAFDVEQRDDGIYVRVGD